MFSILSFRFVVGWIHAAIDNFNAVANAKCVAIGVIKTATFKQNSIHIEGITKVVSLLIGVEMVYHYSIGAFKVIVQFFFFKIPAINIHKRKRDAAILKAPRTMFVILLLI